MLDIKALEKALATIGNVGKGELTVEVNSTPVTMRVLTADEDMDSQRYSRTMAEDEEQVEGLVLLERYKRAVLAYSIVQIGEVDLRGEDFIATGEVTDKGVPVRTARHLVVRKILDGWSRVTTMALFQKYLELQRRVDAEAERAIHFDVLDLDAEISRVEKRLADLRKERERVDVFQKTGAVASAVAASGTRIQEQAQNLSAAAAGEPLPHPPAAVEVAEPEEPARPQPDVVAPPRPPTRPAPAQGAPPVPPAPVVRPRAGPTVGAPPIPPMRPPVRPAPVAEPADPHSFDGMQDSMGDSAEQLAIETARLTAARQQARGRSLDASVAEAPPTIDVPIRRGPPHREAANTSDAVLDSGASTVRAARTSAPRDGIETHRLDTAELFAPRPQAPKDARVRVNEGPSTGPTNPRFRR
jgi:hypothetical protein